MTDATTNGNGTIQSITRHPDYYIPGGDLSILVEHTQFRVHRYFFERESAWFKGQLVQPAAPGSSPQGSSDANSFILESLTPAQFAKFLWVFYNPRYSLYDANLEDWETILRLSERWKFPEVKSLSIRELEKKDITDVKRIKLYHENNVDRNLLIPRYAALCEREEPLNFAEGMDLGMETTLQIASAREQARASLLPSGARSPSTPTVRGDGLRDIIRDLFKIAPGPVTAEDDSQNSGGLKTPPKQEQEKKSPLPPKNQPEKQKNQGKGKGKTGQATTTTTTPPKEPTPPPPPVEITQTTEEETKTLVEVGKIGNETSGDPNTAEPAVTTTTVSGSASPLLDLTGDASSEGNIGKLSSQSPFDPYSFLSKNPSSSPQTSLFGNATPSWEF